MSRPQQYTPMISLTMLGAVLFYVPMALIGYYVFGEGVKSPIYDSLPSGPAVKAIVVAVTAHVLMSFCVIVNVPERAIERYLGISEKLALRIASRTALLLFIAGLAVLLVKVFGPLLDFVSSITSTFTVFILPCACYLKLFKGQLGMHIIAWNWLIMLLAVLGGAFGLYESINEMKDVMG